jgi:predicted PurR-regulated permease PerM
VAVLAALALAGIAVRAVARVHTAAQVLALGAVLAFLLEPAARGLERLVRSRAAAAAILIAAFLAAVAGIGGFLTVAALREAQALANALPDLFRRASEAFPRWADLLSAIGIPLDLSSLTQALAARAGAIGHGAVAATLALVGYTTSTVTTAVASVAVAFYLLLDGRRLRAGLYLLLPTAWHPGVRQVEAVAARVFGGYIRGQLLVAAVFGTLIGLGMWALGLPYPLLLGFQAGVFELLPTVGPVLAAVAPAAIALGLPFPKVWYVIGYFVLAQQLEGNLLVPRISGHAVGLHPVAVILAILGGFELGGLVGATAAVPVVGVAYQLLRTYALPAGASHPPAAPGGTDTNG